MFVLMFILGCGEGGTVVLVVRVDRAEGALDDTDVRRRGLMAPPLRVGDVEGEACN